MGTSCAWCAMTPSDTTLSDRFRDDLRRDAAKDLDGIAAMFSEEVADLGRGD